MPIKSIINLFSMCKGENLSIITLIAVDLIKIVENVIVSMGYPGVFILMLLEGMLLPIPSEVVMTFSGYLAFNGFFGPFNPFVSVAILLVVGSVSDLIGALIAYAIGKYGGDPFIIKYGKYFLLKKDTIDRTKVWFEKYGDLSVFTTRFIPIFRTFISIPAGIATMDVKRFSFFTLIGDVIFNIILIYLGIVLGSHWAILLQYFNQLSYIGVVLFVVVVIYVYLKLKNRSTDKTNK